MKRKLGKDHAHKNKKKTSATISPHIIDDMVFHIFQFLSSDDVMISMTVCKQWYRQSQLIPLRLELNDMSSVDEFLKCRHLSNLTRLKLCLHVDISDILSILNNPIVKKVERLKIEYCYLRNEDLKSISESNCLEQLKMLNLKSNDLHDRGFKYLARCEFVKNLTHLNLSKNDVKKGIKYITRCENVINLKVLVLSECEIEDRGVKYIANSHYLNNLQVLNLETNNLSDLAVKYLAKSPHMTNLNTLILNSNFNIGCTSMSTLTSSNSQIKNLTSIAIKDTGVDEEGHKTLLQSQNMQHLTFLCIGDVAGEIFMTIANSKFMSNLKTLKIFYHEGNRDGILALSNSSHLQNLTSLHLDTGRLTDTEMEILASSSTMSKLQKLSIRDNNVTEDGKAKLQSSPYLKHLKTIHLN